MRRLVLLLWLAPLSPAASREGTRQLGLTQGLEGNSTLRVYARLGETIRVCSSDDGFQDAPVEVDGQLVPIDRDPGRPYTPGPGQAPFPEGRRGREILLSPPADRLCHGDADCAAPMTCHRLSDGVPFEGPQAGGYCAQAFAVTAQRGACDAAQHPGQRRWHERAVDVEGHWKVNFVGDLESLTTSGRSTRFFEVSVVDRGGQTAGGGRLNAPIWRLNAHAFSHGTDTDLYVVADVSAGARVFVVDFDDLRGFRFGVVANRRGITGHERQSWCLFDEPRDGACPLGSPEAVVHRRDARYALYLNYPDPAPAPAPAPALTSVTFEDEVGTPTVSPNGDGTQDEGVFRFIANVDGTYEILVDTDRDGALDPRTDRALRGEAFAGANRAVWDGRDAAGQVVPDGQYRFRVRLDTAETHFPMDDIEANRTGFAVYRQDGPRAERLPQRMYWDDRPVRAQGVDETDPVTSLPEGTDVRRRWVQPTQNGEDVSIVYDTWVLGDSVETGQALCRRCAGPVEVLEIGDDEPIVDTDGDGLLDPDEATGGTDPELPDTDGDGLFDGAEDVSGDGRRDPDETDPLDPDTDDGGEWDGPEVEGGRDPLDPRDDLRRDSDGDGLDDSIDAAPEDPDRDDDGLFDGTEDADRDGQRDPDETDPDDADTDGDGLADGTEDTNRDGDLDPGETDPLVPDVTGGDDPAGEVDAGPDPELRVTGTGGCECRQGAGPGALWPLLLLLGGLGARSARPRRRA